MTALLSLTGVRRSFGALMAVAGVDLAVAAGARHAVIGANGAGKTTLLHTVAGTLRPTGGRISFAGRDITRAGPARRSRLGIARTFQTPALCDSLSVLDNVVLGGWRHRGDEPASCRWRPGRRRRLITRALPHLDTLGLAGLAGTPAGELAHGQRRLLEIAVALAGRPRLLLLDEPAAGLAESDLPRLLACLRQLPDQVTVLLVEHHLAVVAAVADTVTVLHHGEVLTTGTPAEAVAHPAVAEVYLGAAATGAGG